MHTLTVTDRAGLATKLPGQAGRSLMEIIRDAGIEDMLAMCGGSCSCATCHVHVDGAYLSSMPAMGQFERELLEGSVHFNEASRLACQISFSAAIDGIRVTIAPED